ncbi:unnamed protein product [Rotaria socialis]|uniref:Tetratricopeptide repeat protein n=2 Tax=Rotaria socialis TaxID=392032 RepID=A0A817ZAT4_9BILA|nr:unnamed protein product [Rotaria socialis]CAF3441081.1 unnamed protein product [Rotaria socialis]CAF4310953.1 unnamed protein product [Rotaria socialis]CAF4598523.1 unnamed protein product [Rotaria socialis]
MKEEIDGGGWYRMGQLIPRMGYFDQAEELYNELLENSSDDSERANVYNLLGWVKRDQGQYKEAVLFYGKSLEIYQKPLPDDHLSLGTMCSNIGQVLLRELGYYAAALKVLQNAYQIQEKTFQEGNQAFASTFSWYGSVYRDLKEYSKALDYFEKCLTIVRKTLPENHPDFGLTYSNIGDIHHLMSGYEKALAFHHKALNIQENIKRNPLKCATTYTN